MNPEFRTLRLATTRTRSAPVSRCEGDATSPKGWIRAIREASGVTVREMARRLRRAPSAAAHLEGSEAEYRITLGKPARCCGGSWVPARLRPCPKKRKQRKQRKHSGTCGKSVQEPKLPKMSALLSTAWRWKTRAVGGVPEKIEEETKRILKRTGKR